MVYGIGLPTIQYQSMLIPTVCHPTQSQNLSTSNIAGGDRATKSQGLPYNHLKPSCLPPFCYFLLEKLYFLYIYIIIYLYNLEFSKLQIPKLWNLLRLLVPNICSAGKVWHWCSAFWGGPKASAFPKSVRDWVEVAGVVGVDSLARKMRCVSGLNFVWIDTIPFSLL